MQRHDPDGITLVCDYCLRDWDGSEAMIEGHLGSIICLECLKAALPNQITTVEKFKCTMCQRFNIPGSIRYWQSPKDAETFICHECILQSAGTFSKNPDVEWTWDRTTGK